MSIRRRRSKTELYDVYAMFQGERWRLTTVANEAHARAISGFVKDVIACAKFGSVDTKDIRTLETLSEEAYQQLRELSVIFDLEYAVAQQAKEWQERQRWNRERLEKTARQQVENEMGKLARISSAPVPVPRNSPYPPAPAERFEATKYGDNLPVASGVYFVWSGDSCEYVGQSINIAGRATLSHEKIVATDQVGFLLFDRSELLFAESYYIGIMRPQRNFRGFRMGEQNAPKERSQPCCEKEI